MSDEQREAGYYFLTFADGSRGIVCGAHIGEKGFRWAIAEYSDLGERGIASIGATVGPRVQTPAEIAAAIAAARAEGEKAGRDAGVAIGAANMRERCAGAVQAQGYDALADGLRRTGQDEVSGIANATAILAAERAAGREEMRAAVMRDFDEQARAGNLGSGTGTLWGERIRALVIP